MDVLSPAPFSYMNGTILPNSAQNISISILVLLEAGIMRVPESNKFIKSEWICLKLKYEWLKRLPSRSVIIILFNFLPN